jgi:predicted transcriptional regulator of viral defense system
MTNTDQHITRKSLGAIEAEFLATLGPAGMFSTADARRALMATPVAHVRQFLHRLQRKGWIERIRPGLFAVVPLSSGAGRTPQIHEFLIAMELAKPAAIAYFSAMNHHGFTEQLPHVVYVATSHRVPRPVRESLGVTFRIVVLRPKRFFGLQKSWVDQKPFMITDPERTIIDALDLPKNVGGMGTVVSALRNSWDELNQERLREYAARIGNSGVAKRLGFLMESLGVGDPGALRSAVKFGSGFVRLDPTLPHEGKYSRRWGLLLNMKVPA